MEEEKVVGWCENCNEVQPIIEIEEEDEWGNPRILRECAICHHTWYKFQQAD